MKLSGNGIALLKHFEGCVLHPYMDQAGIATIGVGHAIRPGESFEHGITQGQAEALLRMDVATAESVVNRQVSIGLNANQFDACVSLAFNIGSAAFAGSTLLRTINAGAQPDAVKIGFMMWCKIRIGGVLVENPGLRSRRAAEAALFLADLDPQIDASEVLASVLLTSRQIIGELTSV